MDNFPRLELENEPDEPVSFHSPKKRETKSAKRSAFSRFFAGLCKWLSIFFFFLALAVLGYKGFVYLNDGYWPAQYLFRYMSQHLYDTITLSIPYAWSVRLLSFLLHLDILYIFGLLAFGFAGCAKMFPEK